MLIKIIYYLIVHWSAYSDNYADWLC